MKKKTSDVYWNYSSNTVFIIIEWSPDPNGGPAIQDQTFCIKPFDGIDLKVLKWSRIKPKVNKISQTPKTKKPS